MPDNHYEDKTLASLYDIENGWAADSEFFLEEAGTTPVRVVDIGCGTGLLSNAYAAQGHHVVGVEPAAAMLALARQRLHADEIQWVEATAADFKLDNAVDLAVMTGNVFQIFLDDNERLNVLKNCRRHLLKGARLIFDTRSPDVDWKSRWEGEAFLSHQPFICLRRKILEVEKDSISFDTHYQFNDKTLTSTSVLAFPSLENIQQLLWQTGFHLEHVYGGWKREPYDKASSNSIIIIARAI